MGASVNVRRLATRYGVTLVVIGLVAYVLSRLADPASVAAVISDAHPLPYLAAILMFYATFPIRAVRWRLLLEGIDVSSEFRSANVMILLNWFMNTLLPAKAGDLHRSYLASDNYGASKASALGTTPSSRNFRRALRSTTPSLMGPRRRWAP